jgi:LmbE family N-acetylglucosaminyl deacetylase
MVRLRRTVRRVLDTINSVLSRGPDRDFLLARTLVFAPHPDDEALGCGGSILRKIQAGGEVWIVFMTDGAASHPGMLPQGELVATRRREAIEAAAHLGLSADRVTFLDFPDHALDASRSAAIDRVRALIALHAPDDVLVPHAADRLPDHVETNRVVAEAIRSGSEPVRVFEYPVWLWHAWPWTTGRPAQGNGRLRELVERSRDIWHLTFGCRVRVDVDAVLEMKRRALQAHRSQMERLGGNPRWPVLGDVAGGEFVSCFFSGTERFREAGYRP